MKFVDHGRQMINQAWFLVKKIRVTPKHFDLKGVMAAIFKKVFNPGILLNRSVKHLHFFCPFLVENVLKKVC